jgi:predicted transcriptional regulator
VLWSNTQIDDVLDDGPQRLVIIPSHASLTSACAMLAQAGVLSAPVFDYQASVFLGMFDWRDVGAAFVKTALEQSNSVPHSPSMKRKSITSSSENALGSMAQIQTQQVVDLCKKNPLYSIPKNASMLHAMEFFARGIHRLLIAEDPLQNPKGDGVFVGVISQSDAVRYLHAILKQTTDPVLLDMKKKSLRDTDVGADSVVQIQASKSVLEALQLMNDSKVSSIALLGDCNEIQGTLSTTDVKYLFRKRLLSMLSEPCGQFVSSVRLRQGIDNAGKDRSPYFCVSYDSTLEHVIAKMVATRAHRLWIVEQRKALGVVSLSDILKFFTPKTSLYLWHPNFVPAEDYENLNA